jgi:hypothetical protein
VSHFGHLVMPERPNSAAQILDRFVLCGQSKFLRPSCVNGSDAVQLCRIAPRSALGKNGRGSRSPFSFSRWASDRENLCIDNKI